MARLPESERKRIDACRPYGRYLSPRQSVHLLRKKESVSPLSSKALETVVCDLPVDFSFSENREQPASRDISKVTCIRCLVEWWRWCGYSEGVPSLKP